MLRCVARLGFRTLPAFHAAVREEVRSRLSAVRFYQTPGGGSASAGAFAEAERQNLSEAFARLSPDALGSIRQVLSLSALWIYGGRFSFALAYYLCAHLHLLRPRVSLLNTSAIPVSEEIVEVGRGHALVIFDFRDYDVEALFGIAESRQLLHQLRSDEDQPGRPDPDGSWLTRSLRQPERWQCSRSTIAPPPRTSSGKGVPGRLH